MNVTGGPPDLSVVCFCFIGNSFEFPMKQNAPQDAHSAEMQLSLQGPPGHERVASDPLFCDKAERKNCIEKNLLL